MPQDPKKLEHNTEKERYEPPKLERHGTVDELTKAFVGWDLEIIAGSH